VEKMYNLVQYKVQYKAIIGVSIICVKIFNIKSNLI